MFNEMVTRTNLKDFSIPYTLDEKIFIAVTAGIAIFEIAFNLLFDHPITLHSKQETSLSQLTISGAFNSVPHILWGSMGLIYLTKSYSSSALLLMTKYKHSKEMMKLKLKKKGNTAKAAASKETLSRKHEAELRALSDSVGFQKGGLRFSLYLLYISLFTLMQMYFWWFPYFFGLVTSDRFERMHRKLEGVVSILPKNDQYLVPSLEHTILFPMSLCSWILTVRLLFKYRSVLMTQLTSSRWNYVLCWAFTVMICYFPLLMATMVIKKENADGTDNSENNNEPQEGSREYDIGAMITAACLIFINMAFYMILFWSPYYRKGKANKNKESKKDR